MVTGTSTPFAELPSPCYVVDLDLLEENLRVLRDVRERSGATVILALKGFAMWSVFPLVRTYLDGATASSLHEARLAQEEFGGEVHVYAVAMRDDEINAYLRMANHITFNSLSQWERFRERALASDVSCGLRINPQYSEVAVDLYNPCLAGSRFGVTAEELAGIDIAGIHGFHFHTMCEQNADTLERTLDRLLPAFGPYMKELSWLNMGGGHHMTRQDYDVDRLCRCVERVRREFDVDVILEPGEAIALHTGFLVSSVVDIFETQGVRHAILDVSATAHMPDVLEMPYRPEIIGAGVSGEKAETYKLGGLTCLAGDVIGDYSFDTPLAVGQRLVFTDMAHYTMVKNTTFNGVPLPSIATYSKDNGAVVQRMFGYDDFRLRLS